MESQDLEREHLDLLLRASALLNSALSVEGVMAYLLREAVEIVGAQNGYVLLLEEGEWKVQSSIPADVEKVHFSTTIVGQVVREQASVCLLDASQDESFGALSSIQSANLRSVICAPLLWRGEVRGVVYLDHRVSEGVFQESQRRLIEALSQQSAVALENALLHEERERLHEAALRNATEQLAETQAQLFNAHELTAVIAEEARQQIARLRLQLAEGSIEAAGETLDGFDHTIEQFVQFIEPNRSRWRPFSLDEMIGEAIELNVSTSEAIRIRSDLQPTRMKGDSQAVGQVFLNLLSNAEDALARRRGEGEILVRCYQGEGRSILEVSDNGEGMDEAVRARVFEPFFTTRGVGYRSGMGLPVSLQVVRQHGGEISIDSTPGVGTRVLVTFPEL